MEFEGYWVKRRKKRTIQQNEVIETSNGRLMAKGSCPKCGTTVDRFVSAKASKA